MILLKADTNTVAVKTPEKGIPALLIMAGLTTIIYMVARKVVIPAMTSVFTEVLFAFSLNKFSMSFPS
jgi:hypothetical protein